MKTMVRICLVALIGLGFYPEALYAADTVSISLSRPIVRESDVSNPIQVIVSRLSGGSDLPVTVEISGTALQNTDYSVSGLSGYTPTQVRVTRSGSGYSSVPSVTIGGQSGLATASMGLGKATITTGFPRVLYSAFPSVQITPIGGVGSDASAVIELSYAAVVFSSNTISTTLTGSYQVIANESPDNSSGTKAIATITANGTNATISIVNIGSGYSIGQTLTFSATSGGPTPVSVSFSGRAAGVISSQLDPDNPSLPAVPAVKVLNRGVDYSAPPTLTIVRALSDIVTTAVESFNSVSLALSRVDLLPAAGSSVFAVGSFPPVAFSGGGGVNAMAEISGATSTITIPNGERTTSVTLIPIDDKIIEQAETVQFVVVPVVMQNPPYNVGVPSNVVATLADDDMILGWSTVDGLAGEKLFSSDYGFEESTYSLATSLTPQAAPLTTQDPKQQNRYVQVLVDGGTAKLGTDYRLTWMYRHSGQPAGKDMQELRSTDAAVLHGMKVNGSASVGATVIPYFVDAVVSLVSVGDIIQFGSDRTVFYTVRAVNSNTITIWEPLVVGVPDKALIRNNLAALIDSDGEIQGFDIPSATFNPGLIYDRVDFTITPLYDTVIEGAETVQLKLLASNDYLITDPQVQQTTIADDDCLINIVRSSDASRPTTSGGQGINGSFSVVLNRPFPTNLTVPYFVNGNSTATPGLDFEALSGTIVVPAGATSALIPVIPLFGGSAIRALSLTLLPTDNYVLLGSETGGVSPSASINILNQVGTVSVSKVADGSEVASPGVAAPGQFRVDLSRIAGNTSPLSVQYTVSGTATSGVRYTPLTGTVNIPQGSSSATIDVAVLDDQIWQVDQTVIITLQNAAGYNVDPANSAATLSIKDNEPYVVIGTVINGNVIGNVPVQIPVVLCDSTGNPLTAPVQNDVVVTYRLDNGTSVTSDVPAIAGTNYTRPYNPATTGTITIPKGQLSASFSVPVLTPADPVVDMKFTAVLPVVSPASYGLLAGSSNQSKVATIAGNQLSVGLTLVRNATLDAPGLFTFTLAPTAASTETIVRYSVSGSARPGLDFQPLSGSVRIPAGSLSASLPVSPLVGGSQSILTLKVQNGSGYLPRGAGVDMIINPTTVSPVDPSNETAGGGSCGLGGGVAIVTMSLLMFVARFRRSRLS